LPEPLLNANQKRSLSVALRLVEEIFDEVESLILSGPRQGTLLEFTGKLSAEEGKELLERLALGRQVVKEMVRRFALEKVPLDLRSRLTASLTYLWTVLADAYSKDLRDYGPISEELPQFLDPSLDRLEDLVQEMKRIVLGRGDSRESR